MPIYDFNVTTIEGNEISLSQYEGKVLLIVNVASECGFTKQYKGLEELYRKYKHKGLVVLGFPSNQFGAQEPGTEEEIATFCRVNYGVTFPMFSKIDVNGINVEPLYAYLKSEKTGFFDTKSIKWNFTKFLVNHKGEVIERFGSTTKPDEIQVIIEELLK